MSKHRTGQKPRDTRGQKSAQVEQVDSKTLIPPTEPAEPTEKDIDFAKAEKELAEATAKVKTMKKALGQRKRQALGGKKLQKRRLFAADTTSWAVKAAAKFAESVDRANEAVGKLKDYEEELQLPEREQQADALGYNLEKVNNAREQLS